MAKYIERETLLKDVVKIGGFPWSEWETAGVFDVIAKQPVADVAPVVHGRWEKSVVIQTDTSTLYDYTCSECSIVTSRESNYCPNCGARMDGE